ncbi:MAG: TolC family protein [Deltaproteobacteria bacterium]|nr:TolC family protein [Deltaproteobacteria bacterium]
MENRIISLAKFPVLLVIIFFLFFLFSGAAWAGDSGEEMQKDIHSPETSFENRGGVDNEALRVLSEYLSQASLNNPDLEAAFHRWKSALEKVPQVKALPDPRFTFGYFIRSIETRTGPQRARFGIAQTFPWFGKLDLKGDMAMQEANALKAQYDIIKLKIFNSVKNAFYEYAYLAKAVEISRENIELLRYLENVIRTRYSAGATPYSDVIRTQVELGKLEDRLKTLEDFRKPIMARLIAAMNMPVDSELPWPADVPVMLVSLTDKELFEQLPENNPQVKKYEYLEAKAKAGTELAQKEFFPDFTFGLQTIATDPASGPMMIEDSGDDPVIASVSINIPLWGGKRRAAVREAEAKRLSAVKGNEAIRQALLSDMQLALYRYRDAQRKINLYQNTLIPKADQSLGVTLEAFQAGTRSSLDLIDAEKTLLEFQLSYIRALADQAQRVAELEMLLGKEIPCKIHGSLMPKSGIKER